MSTPAQYAYHYTARLGLGLVPIPSGQKRPITVGWQDNPITNPQQAREIWAKPQNMGLVHDVSRTCTIDIDHMGYLQLAAAGLSVDLLGMIEAAPLKIKGKNGAKPLFRLPEGQELGFHKLMWPHEMEKLDNGKPRQVCVVEFRTGPGKQDVLPPSIHPDTQQPYEWVGTPPRCYDDIPELPAELVSFWLNLNEHLATMKAACPWATMAPVAPDRPVKRFDTPFQGESAIEAVESRYSPDDLLEAEGYKARGQGRYLSPHSSTGDAGVLVEMCADGKRRAKSFHASDSWADERWHDAFDLYCLFRHGGDVKAAIQAARDEFGLTAPQSQQAEPSYSLDDARSLWAKHGSDVLGQAGEYLAATNLHHHAREALLTLTVTIYHMASEGNLRGSRTPFSLDIGGLKQLAALVGGQAKDCKPRLEWLEGQGLIGALRRVDPTDPRSGYVIDLPADPRDLRFLGLTPDPLKPTPRPKTSAVQHDKNTRAAYSTLPPVYKSGYARGRVESPNTKNPLRALLSLVICIGRNKNIGLKSISLKTSMRVQTVRRKWSELQELGYLDVSGNLTCSVDQYLNDMRAVGAEGARKRLMQILDRQRSYAAGKLASICYGEGATKNKKRYEQMEKRCTDQLERLYSGEAPYAVLGRVA